MNETIYTRLITASLTGDITEQEQLELSSWLKADPANQQVMDQYRKLWDAGNQLQDYKPDIIRARKRLLEAFDAADGQQERGKVIPFRWQPMLRYAAILVIGLVSWVSYKNFVADDTIQLATGPQQEQHVELPDGTVVWLNRNSALEYAQDFTKREVTLTGEAYFDVVPDAKRPFSIQAGQTKTTVLGTAFNVRSYPSEVQVEVTVVEGKVRFEDAAQAEKVVLIPGETGLYDADQKKVSKKTTEKVNVLAWKENLLVFKDSPIDEIFSDVYNYFGVRIQAKNPELRTCRISGKLQDPKLDDVLELIHEALNFEITKQDDMYLVDGTPCD